MVYGSSDAGIDRIVEQTCKKRVFRGIPLIGITCPRFVKWVPDEKTRPPLIIEKSKEKYAELFTDLLDLLIITGGREHTLRNDLMALAKGKRVVVMDCAPKVRPAFEGGEIQNAAGLLLENLYLAGGRVFTSIKEATRGLGK